MHCPQKSRAEERLLIGSRFSRATGNDCAGQGYSSFVMAQCQQGPCTPAPPCTQHLAMLSISPAQHLAMLRCSSLQTLKRKLSKQGRRGRRLENWLCGSPWTQLQSTHERCLLISSECIPSPGCQGHYPCIEADTCSVWQCVPVLRTKTQAIPSSSPAPHIYPRSFLLSRGREWKFHSALVMPHPFSDVSILPYVVPMCRVTNAQISS